MMRFVGLVVLILGFAVMAAGLAFAFQSFVGIYHDVTNDPLAQSAASGEPERDAARQMLTWAVVGLIGAIIAGVGAAISMVAKRRHKRAQRLTA